MDGGEGALGIEQEVAQLYEREGGALLRYATSLAEDRETAHDALQEAFFRFFLCRSGGQQIHSPRGWLFRVAHNYVLDQKKAGFRKEVGIESLANMPGPAHNGPSDSRVPDLLQELPHIGLSAREIECVRLRAQDLRYDEIALVLGLQSGTVGALLARAHGKIRKAMSDRGHRREDFRIAPAPEKRYAS